jgi:transcriptional regulator with PAS, ATPase and Fis domain
VREHPLLVGIAHKEKRREDRFRKTGKRIYHIVLEKAKGNQIQAAKQLGIYRATLLY